MFSFVFMPLDVLMSDDREAVGGSLSVGALSLFFPSSVSLLSLSASASVLVASRLSLDRKIDTCQLEGNMLR